MPGNYRTLTLQIEKEAARKLISQKVGGMKVRERSGTIEYSMPSGMHLATLTDIRLPNGERGSRLKYRTAIVSTWAIHARTKAREIHDAVPDHKYPGTETPP